MNKSLNYIGLSVVIALGSIQVAKAHTSLDVKEAIANSTFIAAFNVGHGCGVEGEPNVDTYKLVVDVPGELSVKVVADTEKNIKAFSPNIRAFDEAWGATKVIKNSDAVVTQLVWEKESSDPNLTRDEDTYLYQARVRMKLPDTPFTTIKFPAATQYCMQGGTELNKSWTDEVVDGKDVLNAPRLHILPGRKPGWNEHTAPRDLSEADIKAYFANAVIVWVGDEAYSPNSNTASAITKPLKSIASGAKIWAKY